MPLKMRHIERGQFNEDRLANSNLHRKLEVHPRKLPQYLLMPKSFFGNLDTGITLTKADKCERAQYIYSIMGGTSTTKIFRGKKHSIGKEFGIFLEQLLYVLTPPPLKPAILTHWHTHPSEHDTLPSIQDIQVMFRENSMFSVIGSPTSASSLFVSTKKSHNYCKKNSHTYRSYGNVLLNDVMYRHMDEKTKIGFIKSLGFGVYHQVKHKSDIDYLWKKSR